MPDQWESIARTLRQRTHNLTSMRGLAWLGLVVVGGLWVVGLADWWLHLDTSWLRLLLALGFAGGIGVTIWRTLWRPLRVKLTDVDLARSIERRFPRWGDRLSSAAQFRAEHYAERLGSPALQQVITTGVDERLGEIDLEQVVDPQPTRRLALVAAAVCVLGITGALWQRSAAATALTRLALPFADVAWPRTTQLQFLNDDLQPLTQRSQRTAAGEPHALYLENRLGDLPEDVLLELRLPDGRDELRNLQTTILRDESGRSHEVGIANLNAHAGPIRYRAVGGDDRDMPWSMLEVVPAPALASLTMTITPPAYTHAPPQTFTGAGQVEALVGSRIDVTGEANTALSRADLRREGHVPQPMNLGGQGRRFEASFVIEEAGHGWYWFDVADKHDLSPNNPPRYELRGIADRKPTVFIDQPGGDVTLTPDADLPLRIIVRDDLGVKRLRLVHSRPDDAPASLPLPLSAEMPTDETVETLWSLASLGLASGDHITFHAEAVDAFDLPDSADQLPELSPRESDTLVLPFGPVEAGPVEVGQVGLSAHRHIDILSTEEKRRELAARQMGILDSLKELQERQSQALESTAGLRIQSELVDRLQADDLDLLKQTELEQQHIRDQLVDERSGALREVDRLRQELERNHIDDVEMAGGLDQLADELNTLTSGLLPTIEQSLARARKLSQPGTSDSSSQTQQQLRAAEQSQSQALALLNEATSQLGGWQRQYEVTSELDDLIADQSDVQQQTQEVGRETLTKRPDALSPQQQADLARLSDRQRRLASRLEELIKRGTEQSPENEDADPGAEAVREALRQLAQRSTVGHMHNAAESLRRNDIAGTAEAQEQVLSDLRDFGELLQSGDQEAAETLLSSLREQTEQVETLRKRQDELARRARQSMGPSADPDRRQQLERLMKQQSQLAEQADELARQLRRQQHRKGAQSAARAARRMREAQQAIEQQQPQQTADSQQEALDDLTQLAEELAQRQQQIEHDLARQQVEQLADDLQDLADRQESLITLTVDLDERQRQRGSWSRTLKKELHELTDGQSGLADRLDELRNRLSEYPVIGLALQQAADPMRAAIETLNDNDVGQTTSQQQRTALQRLLAVVEVARQSQASQQPDSPGGPPQAPQQQPGQQQSQIPKLLATQLRLLRHLQSDVQQRTAELTQRLQDDEADPQSAASQRRTLADDQRKIAELTRILLEQFAETSSPAEAREQP